MGEILITRPCYDLATSYIFYYAGLIVDEAEDTGVPTIDLKRPRLTQKILTDMIKEKSPGFLFFNAHGNEKTIFGDKIDGREEVLIQEGTNHNLLDGKIIYARACNAAASLGKACKDGCFVGYSVRFRFWTDDRWSANPSNDSTAKLFFEPSNLIASSLLRGNTAEESVNKSIIQTKKNILKLLKEQKEPGATASIMLLWNNMTGLEICGNKEMKFR